VDTELHVQEHALHLPPSSLWPLIMSVGIGFIPFGVVFLGWGSQIVAELLLICGGSITTVSLMGWAQSVIRDKSHPGERSLVMTEKDLIMFLKYFLISEAAIFAALFVHYYYNRYQMPIWPPLGSPEMETHLPALATLILMFSSFTCEMGHRAFKHGDRIRAKYLTVVTIVLGLIFLGFQGYEWGALHGQYDFTTSTNLFGTMFYMMTGFHGLHVATGVVMLALVYGRMEMGHMTEQRHFALLAASWYWHFVDVIWIGLFFSLYLI
jgi:cytochrome c oxidase subunit 3